MVVGTDDGAAGGVVVATQTKKRRRRRGGGATRRRGRWAARWRRRAGEAAAPPGPPWGLVRGTCVYCVGVCGKDEGVSWVVAVLLGATARASDDIERGERQKHQRCRRDNAASYSKGKKGRHATCVCKGMARENLVPGTRCSPQANATAALEVEDGPSSHGPICSHHLSH